MLFTFVYSGWEGTANDSRVFLDALNPENDFPKPLGEDLITNERDLRVNQDGNGDTIQANQMTQVREIIADQMWANYRH
ncbi:hypothetical protein PIB30_016316 [Stylosanthes scabra]|uniref:Transposase n=1 Tax=Stylosanthes scabra TaxID=79078 RepID=A0ABU6R7K9_9FABA|nr:hypothetical protein [Stylosanthes scabra]